MRREEAEGWGCEEMVNGGGGKRPEMRDQRRIFEGGENWGFLVAEEMGCETEGEPGGHSIDLPFWFSGERDGKFWGVRWEGFGVS